MSHTSFCYHRGVKYGLQGFLLPVEIVISILNSLRIDISRLNKITYEIEINFLYIKSTSPNFKIPIFKTF